MRARSLLLASFLGASAALLTCDRFTTAETLNVRAPDGSVAAIVLSHPSIDPPRQSLGLRAAGGEVRVLRRLAEDQDWCRQAYWSGDSSTVVFLVQDAHMLAYSRSGELLADRWLVEPRGYPTTKVARQFALSPDGTTATYRACTRSGARDASGKRCSDAVTVQVRPAPRPT